MSPCRGDHPRHGRVLGGWQDQDAGDLLAEIRSEVLPVAGQQMGRSAIDRRQQDRQVLIWQADASRQGEVLGLDQVHPAQQPGQPAPLRGRLEVPAGLLDRVVRRQELHALQPPEPLDRRSRPPGGGKQDVGVQEDRSTRQAPGGL